MDNDKKIVKIGSVELYEDEALKLYQEKKYIVSYGGVYQLHYSDAQNKVYGQKVIDQKGIAKRGRFYTMTAEAVNNVLGEKVLNVDTEGQNMVTDNKEFWLTNVKNDEDIRNEIQKAVEAGTTVEDIDDYLNELYDKGIINDEQYLNRVDYVSSILPKYMMDDYLNICEVQTKKR